MSSSIFSPTNISWFAVIYGGFYLLVTLVISLIVSYEIFLRGGLNKKQSQSSSRLSKKQRTFSQSSSNNLNPSSRSVSYTSTNLNGTTMPPPITLSSQTHFINK